MTEQNQTEQTSVDQNVLDLINRSIDAEISAQEQDELDRLLTASPEVHNLNEELRTVTRLLDEVQELNPPEYLQDSIERQVRLPVQDHADSKNSGFCSIVHSSLFFSEHNDLHHQRPTQLAASAPPRFLPSGECFCYPISSSSQRIHSRKNWNIFYRNLLHFEIR